MTEALDHMRPSQRCSPDVFDIPSTWLAVADAYDAGLDAEWNWDSSDIPPTGEAKGHSSLLVDFTVIRNKCVDQSFKALTTADDVFKMDIRRSTTVSEQRELSASETVCTVQFGRPRQRHSRFFVKYRRTMRF